jgi:hypothetical protein
VDADVGRFALGAWRAREAADRGVLVPARFSAASLPLDVRAIHTIDLDGWNDDPASKPCQELLRALEATIVRQGGVKVPARPLRHAVQALRPASRSCRSACCRSRT